MIEDVASIRFFDEESESNAIAIIRRLGGKIAFSISAESNGDIDTLMTKEKAMEIANALIRATNE